MDKKPTLSPSKITTYLACPHKYYWTHVDPRGRWYMRARSCFSFGLSLHKVLQRFHDSEDRGVETTHQAIAALEENWLDAGFSSAEEMADAFGEGKAIVTRYVEDHSVPRAGADTLYVEKLLSADMGDFVLIGRLDRVDEHDDGTLEVIDYKSGRQTVTAEDVRDDVAMGCYQLLLQNQFPDRPIKGGIFCLRTGQQASYSFGKEEMAEFEFALREIGREIICRNFEELAPFGKGLCKGCDFHLLCRRHPEYA